MKHGIGRPSLSFLDIRRPRRRALKLAAAIVLLGASLVLYLLLG